MNLRKIRRGLRLGAILLTGAVAVEAAHAQMGPGGFTEDSGAALNRHLKELADSPRSLSALLGAAKAALDLGDPQAAVTFYARAEEIAPRDGRIKAGLGAAFLAMEQPTPALRFLDDARALGLPEGVIAADRGLAHDLLGDPVAAQRDYAMAMRANDNDELRRRLALSRAISGDRGGALAAIEEQVRRKDPAAWRVRAFVLALTGDTAGATDATRAVMPAQAVAMQPFFERLPSLRPADRAMAVHFGRFPGDAPPGQAPAPLPNYAGLPPGVVLGGKPDPAQASLTPRTSLPGTSNGSLPVQQNVQVAARAPGQPSGPAATRPVAGPSLLPERRVEPARSASPAPTVSPAPVNSAPSRSVQASPEASRPDRTARPRNNFPTERGLGQLARRPTSPVRQAPATQQAVSRPVVSSPAQTAPATQSEASAEASAPPTQLPSPIRFAARSAPVQGPPDGEAAPVVITPAPAPAPVALPPAQQPAPEQEAPTPGISAIMPPPSNVAPETVAAPTQVAVSAPAVPDSASVSPALRTGSEPAATVPSTSAAPARPVLGSGLASLADTIRALPSSEPAATPAAKAPPPKSRPVEIAANTATPVRKAQAAPAPPKEPSRHWVQVAGSADRNSLIGEFARIRGKAPKLLTGKTAWTTPLRFTNRLLVGPFKSDEEAQAFVNELAKAELTAFTWTSPAGQEIVKLAGK